MRIEQTFTSVSWIPSEAVTGRQQGHLRVSGFTHYDSPPPDVLVRPRADGRPTTASGSRTGCTPGSMSRTDRVVDAGYIDGSVMGATTVRLGKKDLARFAAVKFQELRAEPEMADDVGAVRADVRRPCRAAGAAACQPSAVHEVRGADGVDHHRADVARRRDARVRAASARARSRGTGCYDNEGKLAAKAGLADFKEWWRHSFGKHTPWGDEDRPRSSPRSRPRSSVICRRCIMRAGEKRKIRKLKEGQVLVEQGQPGDELYLLLDGVLSVEVDGDVARRARTGCDPRRAGDHRRRPAHRDAARR